MLYVPKLAHKVDWTFVLIKQPAIPVFNDTERTGTVMLEWINRDPVDE